MKQEFIDLLRSTGREGMENLIGYLDQETDFFTAPASTQYHGAYQGGLLEHSLAVYVNLKKVRTCFDLEFSDDTAIVCSLLHDICKANFYKETTRNVKNPDTGKWEQVPYYAIEDQLPLGHGEKSAMIIQRFIRPTVGEIMAIRWHMGGFDDTGRSFAGSHALAAAMERYPLVTALHMADLASNCIQKK